MIIARIHSKPIKEILIGMVKVMHAIIVSPFLILIKMIPMVMVLGMLVIYAQKLKAVVILISDGDGVGDECDNCPEHPNPTQIPICRQCPIGAPSTDTDRDGVADVCDNCPTQANSNQRILRS